MSVRGEDGKWGASTNFQGCELQSESSGRALVRRTDQTQALGREAGKVLPLSDSEVLALMPASALKKRGAGARHSPSLSPLLATPSQFLRTAHSLPLPRTISLSRSRPPRSRASVPGKVHESARDASVLAFSTYPRSISRREPRGSLKRCICGFVRSKPQIANSFSTCPAMTSRCISEVPS